MPDSIQTRTFTNWLNLQLDDELYIQDLTADLADGQRLIAVVERLQKKRCTGKIYTRSPSELQCTMNVQMALDALREDGMRLVNIAAKDIVDGDIKVVHSLVWLLISRYHIASRTKIPAKKLIMAWIQSALPDLTITNFRSAWNDGRALSALLEYCQPGLCPEWRGLPPQEGLLNCDRALDLADRYLDVPRILSSRDLHDDQLDEQSLLTYLAYFVRVYGPGYAATLARAQDLLGDLHIPDLSSSWADGYQLSLLVESVGGTIPHEMRFDTRADWVQNVEGALAASEQLGIRSLVSAEDIVDGRPTDHLGVMSLVAALCSLNGNAVFPVTQSFQNQQVNIDLAFGEGEEVRVDDLTVEVLGPSSTFLSHTDISLHKARTRAGVVLSLIPTEVGPHQVRIFCQGEELPSSPVALQVLPLPASAPTLTVESTASRRERSESLASTALPSPSIDENNLSFAERRAAILQKLEPPQPQVLRPARELLTTTAPIQKPTSPPPPPPISGSHREPTEIDYGMPPSGLVSFSGLAEPCPVGSIVEVVINAHGEAAAGAVQVEAVSPSGKKQKCSVRHSNTHYTATFTPHEVGSWKIGILYDNEHINESPFDCKVFDATQVNVYGLNVGLVGQQLKFSVNTAQAGVGDLEVSVVRLGQVIPSDVQHQGDKSSGIYTVSFTPEGAGQYNIHVLFNKMQAKGSPFILDIADASSVSVYGDNLKVASVDKLSSFIIHAVNASVKDITVSISAPSGKQKLARISQIDPETFRAEWKAVEAGEHQIDVRLYDQSVYEEPITCNVGDPDLVTVKGMPKRILSRNLGQEHCFEIDASAAGSGNLEIMINGGRVPCRVRELGSRQYLALFTPGQSAPHTVEMRFNGEEVRGSPWHIHCEDSEGDVVRRDDRSMSPRGRSIYSEISGSGLVRAAVGKNSTFDITGDSIELEDIKAVVTTPDGREVPVRIAPKGVGKFTAEYRIHEVGEHQLNVWIAGRKVDTSPLYIAGYSSERVKLEPLGGGVPGQPVQFVVDAVDAGKGQLEISVNQGRVPNNVQMQGAGRCLVTFIPQQPGTYVIDVTFNGELVHGCPIRVEILPKQVGQQVVAPLHTTTTTHETTTSTSSSFHPGAAIAGSTVLSSSTGPRSPTSPTLLRAARQRENEGTPRSASLLRDIGSSSSGTARYETAGYRGASYSPRRGEGVYSPDSYGSPMSTLRREQLDREREYAGVHHEGDRQPQRQYAETTTTYRTESPQTTLSRTTDLPPSRQLGSSSVSSATTVHTVQHRTNRSPSPGSRRRPIEQLDPLAAEAERESRRGAWQRDAPPSDRGLGYTVAAYGERGIGGDGRTDSPTFQQTRQRFERREEEVVAPAGRPPPRPITPPRDFDVDDEKPQGIMDKIVEKSKDFTDAVEEEVDKAKETLSHFFHRDQKDDKKGREQSEERMMQSPERESSPSRRARIAGRPITPPRDFDDVRGTTSILRSTTTPSGRDYDSGILRSTTTSSGVDAGAVEKTPFYKSYTEEGTTYRRSMSPQDDYRSTRDRSAEYRTPHMFVETETERTVSPTGDEVRETTTTRTTTYSVSPRAREVDVHLTRHSDVISSTTTHTAVDRPSDRRDPSIEEHHYPDASLRRVATEAKDKMREGGVRAGDRFTRTQSDERVDQHKRQPSEGDGHLRRTDEVERIYDDVPRHELHSTTVTRREEVPTGRVDTTITRREDLPPARFEPTVPSSRYEPSYPREDTTRYETRETSRREEISSGGILGSTTTTTTRKDEPRGYEPREPSGFVGGVEERRGYEARDPFRDTTTVTQEPAGRVDRYETTTVTTSTRDSGAQREYDDGRGHVDPVYDQPPRESGHFDERFVGEVQQLGRTNELPHSPPVSTPTTPKMSSKFKKEGDHKMFDFGKSKFSSKHEVIRRGKEVEVKLDNLKLSKEDTLRIVVMAPMKHSAPDEPPAEIEPKVKKSGTKFEISFKPTDVGTHKVFAYVNEVLHPLSPYAIRVYDAAEIVVGEIPQHSYLNDTVEFTVDAGRAGFGNLEMAIKDADGVIIPSHVAQLESGTAKFLVTFSPTTRGSHTVNITFNKEVLRNSPFEVVIADAPAVPIPSSQMSPGLGAEVDIPPGSSPTSPDLSKRDAKKLKEDQKREEKERAKREKEEKAATLKREKELKKQLKKAGVSPGVLPKSTSVTKIPSLSRVGAPAAIQVAVAGQDSLEITVTHAKKDEVGTKVTEVEPGLLEIEFVPQHVGEHEIDVRYAGAPVPGSPFTCRAYDPAKIAVGTIPNGVVDRPVHFVVDASEAGVGNLEVAVNDGKIPSMANGLGQHRYDISFTPHEEIDHHISVRFNNEPVPGSPFLCRLVSATRVSAIGPGLERVAVDEEATFTVHTQGEDESAPIVSIRGPHAAEVKPVIEKSRAPNEWVVRYAPTTVGSYQIDISHAGEPIAGSPFAAKAYDVRQVKLAPCEAAQVGRPCHFSIDAANAGAGNMEIIVSVDKKNVPNFVQSEGQARFRVSFTPQEEKSHTISVKFNGQPVTGSPMTCEVAPVGVAPKVAAGLVGAAAAGAAVATHAARRDERSASDLSDRLGDGKHAAVIGQPKGFAIPAGGRGDCNVIVTDANGGPLPVRCYKQADDSYWVEFTPEHTGVHTIEATFGDVPIVGSPFKCTVVDPKKVTVTGVDAPMTLRHVSTIAVKRADAGTADLTVEVTDPSGSPVRTEMMKSPRGEDSYTFLPTKTGPHRVAVKCAGFSVPGSPFIVDVEEHAPPTAYGGGIERAIEIGAPASIIFDAKRQTGGVQVEVKDPNGDKIKHKLNKRDDGTMEVNFEPREIGTHRVHVVFNSMPVPGSPFKVDVVDAAGVQVRGIEESLLIKHAATVRVDTSRAGNAPIEVDVTDPVGAPVRTEVLRSPMGEDKITFLPARAGPHRVDVRIGGVRVPGFPRTVDVDEDGEARAPRVVLADLENGGRVGDALSFVFDARKQVGGLKVEVRGPDGRRARHQTRRRDDGAQEITFYPEEVGEYIANVEHNNSHVQGSPLTLRVVDPSKVLVDDESLDREGRLVLAPSQRATLNVDVTAAGPGKLRAEVEDEQGRAVSGASVEEIGFGKHRVNWTPRTPGTYMLYLSYEGHPVRGANPLKMVVGGEGAAGRMTTQSTTAAGRGYDQRYEESSTVTRTTHDRSEMPSSSGVGLAAAEAGRVHLSGDGVSRPLLNEPNEFIIDASDCDREGQLTATMYGSKMDVPVRLTNIGKNKYRASYTPLSPGKYELRVEWDGAPVQGTPMTIEVAPTAASAADQIVVDSTTLKIGVINDDVKTLIDTRKAGPGQLSAQCMGPVKLAYCELYDHRDGTYTLSVKPTEVGKHTLTIKYNERHVPGSPFLVHVSNPPDASKVRVYGPGIEHGILSHFKSNFVVETKGAGAGQLTVRVRGPKGAFNVEMQREKKNERTIHCKYEPREPGDYQVEVKWHGEHVPGSPYLVMIVDTEQELTRFLRGEAPSPIPATPFIPPGWVGPAPPPPHMFMGGPPGGPRFLPPGGPPPPGMHMAPYGAMPPPGARMAQRHGKYANGY